MGLQQQSSCLWLKPRLLRCFQPSVAERISLFNSFSAVGRAVAPFLGGYILFATNESFFTLYVAVGIAGITAFVIALLFLAEKRTSATELSPEVKSPRKMFSDWLTIIKNTRVLGVSFVHAAQYYVFGSVEFFLVGYLTDVVKLDLFSIGVIPGSEIVALVIARPLIGRVSNRMSRTKPILAGIVASCVLIAAIPFTTQFSLLLPLAVGYGVSFATVHCQLRLWCAILVPATLVGASMGFLSTMMDLGQTIGPIVSGVIFATNLHYAGLFLSLSLLLIISIVVFVLPKKKS